MTEENEKKSLNIGRLILSVLAAAIGVQSNKNREQDFQSKSIVPYIIAGVIFTALFLFTLIFIVSLIVN